MRSPAKQTDRRILRGLITGSVSTALVAWILLVVRGEYDIAWLTNAEGPLDEIVFLGLTVATVAWTIGRWSATGTSEIAVRIVLAATAASFTGAASELVARYVFRDVRSGSDGRSYFATRGLPVRVNSLGFRDPEVAAKRSDRYRIVIVGDSITWGQGLAEPERFSNLLSGYLGERYEVLNFGVPGSNMPEHLQTLERALRVSPDFVLLQLYINDFETPEMERPRAAALVPWLALDRRLYRSSVLYDLLTGEWTQFQEAIGFAESYPHYMRRNLGDPNSRSSREAFGMLRQFIEHARAAGVPSGTVLFPNPGLLGKDYPFEYLHDRVWAICAEEHIHCVDLRAAFAASFAKSQSSWVSRFDSHPNARAHRRASAEILHEFDTLWQH